MNSCKKAKELIGPTIETQTFTSIPQADNNSCTNLSEHLLSSLNSILSIHSLPQFRTVEFIILTHSVQVIQSLRFIQVNSFDSLNSINRIQFVLFIQFLQTAQFNSLYSHMSFEPFGSLDSSNSVPPIRSI